MNKDEKQKEDKYMKEKVDIIYQTYDTTKKRLSRVI